jgi:hypothetical protein
MKWTLLFSRIATHPMPTMKIHIEAPVVGFSSWAKDKRAFLQNRVLKPKQFEPAVLPHKEHSLANFCKN